MICLVRHAESKQNTGEVNTTEIGDCNVPLSDNGILQSMALGRRIGPKAMRDALHYSSSYLRCIQTRKYVLEGAGCLDIENKVYIDPRLREMCFGYNKTKDDVSAEKELRKIHGWFYYRMNGGDSPADVYDRVSTFLESLKRQVKRKKNKNVYIFTHGITIRSFVMRFLHLSDKDYAEMDNNNNCDVVTIAHAKELTAPQFTRGKWGVEGLIFRGDD